MGSYAPISAPSPTFKTILELVLWNGLQSFRRITPDVIMSSKCLPINSSFIFGNSKSHWGLDPVEREGFIVELIVYLLKSPSRTVPWEQVHCRDARSMSCWKKFWVVPSKFFMQPFHNFQMVNLVDCPPY
jgi:hypothetical protein